MKQFIFSISLQLLLLPAFWAQSDKAFAGDPPKAGESTFTIKGTSGEGEQVIEVRIYDKENMDEPMHTTVWQRGTAGPVEFIWSDGDYSFVVEQSGSTNEGLRLARILESALDLYLDGSIKYNKTNLELRRSVPDMLRDMNAIVQSGTAHYTDDAVFGGFSPAVQKQLELVGRMEWSNARFAINGGSEQDKYLAIYHFVNKQVQDLKDMVHQEINTVADATVLSPVNSEEQFLAARKEFFDENEFMYPLDLKANTADKEIELVATAPKGNGKQKKVKKRDAWLLQELSGIKPEDRCALKQCPEHGI